MSNAFLFYLYVHHPDLHSFPTRRSSDLTFSTPTCIKAINTARLSRFRTAPTRMRTWRSEENTPELQALAPAVVSRALERKTSGIGWFSRWIWLRLRE